MQDLRIVLVIIGALAIAALVIHGLWTNRKNKRLPIKEKPLGRVSNGAGARRGTPAPQAGDGFDEDGIGKVRVVSRRDEMPDHEPQITAQPKVAKPAKPAKAAKSGAAAKVEPAMHMQMPQMSALDDEPVMDVETPAIDASPVMPTAAPVEKVWQDFYLMNIMAREGHHIDGQDLLYCLKKLGFVYGEMDIFDRHLEVDGRGEVLFSVANMVKPGTFDPARMSNFYTPGISLFMQLPAPGRAEAHLKLMLQAAGKLVEELDALLMDIERKPMSELTLATYFDEVHAYDQQHVMH